MTRLRLVPLSPRALDAALASVDRVLLARRGGEAYAEIHPAAVASFVRALAFAGVRTEETTADLAAPQGASFARGVDLAPLPPDAVALDVIRLERLVLGRATRELMRPRLRGLVPASDRSRARCRELLRGRYVTFAWSRSAWGSRLALRRPPARASLRPVVFSRDAGERAYGRVATDGDAIGAWLFA